MLHPEQPPPDAPAPPPGVEALKSRAKMRLIYWIGGLSILILAIGASIPVTFRSKKTVERTIALNNVRQIGIALFEFQADYGNFPSASTIPDVKSRTGTALTFGDGSSNQLFRQLLVTHLKSEKPFYAKVPGAKRPNDVFHSDATALAKGECVFSYVTGLRSGDASDLPIVMTPMLPGTYKFSNKSGFPDKAIILRLDGSTSLLQIQRDGEATLGGGVSLFDPKVWGSVKPNLRWPE